MSSVSILGDTSGSVLLQAPAVAGSGTLTLPVGTGTLNLPQADTWFLTSNTAVGAVPYYITNVTQAQYYGVGKLGAGMSQSSGVFTFPTTGYWQITANMSFYDSGGANCRCNITIYTTTNNSTYSAAALNQGSCPPNLIGGACSTFVFYVSDTTQCKVKFGTGGKDGTPNYYGGEGPMATYFTFVRIGG